MELSTTEQVVLASEELKELQDKGYLFHGSPNPAIEELEPRPARDVDETQTFNIDTAVFATDMANSSVIFGVVGRSELPEEIRYGTWGVSWEEGCVHARIPASWKPYIERSVGYVYVLSNETFTERRGNQLKSKVTVKPIKRVAVTLQDFYAMGGTVEWQE